MKSGWLQEATICAATFVSAASRLSRTILRPPMPPAALHQSTKACDSWKISTLSPGTTVLPGSDMVATWMSVSVTPLSVAPLALPGPHTPLSDPKSPGPGVAAAAVVGLVPPAAAVVGAAAAVVDDELDAWLLHAPATSATARAAALAA